MQNPTRSRAHLCLVHTEGDPHAMALLDPLLQIAEALRSSGVEVTTGRNRLHRGATNLVFGAHMGFAPELTASHDCVFVNLEQLGQGGKFVSPDYLALLSEHAVVDYHEANPLAYGREPSDVPMLTLGFAPELAPTDLVPLQSRPVDLLFLGTVLEGRAEVLRRLRSTGLEVVVPPAPVYGPERDDLVRSAKAVLNVPAFAVSRFEQVRAALCLSLGTPLVSERRALTTPGERAWEPFVSWFERDSLERWFSEVFLSPEWFVTAAEQLRQFPSLPTLDSVTEVWRALDGRAVPELAPPLAERRVNLATDSTGYRAGWLNAGLDARSMPDVLVSRWSELQGATVVDSEAHGTVRLGGAELVLMDGSGEELAEQSVAALHLLADGGSAVADLRPGADTGPLERLLEPASRWGSVTHRLELASTTPVDAHGRPCHESSAHAVRLQLVRAVNTPGEVTAARTQSEDFGGILPRFPVPGCFGASAPQHLDDGPRGGSRAGAAVTDELAPLRSAPAAEVSAGVTFVVVCESGEEPAAATVLSVLEAAAAHPAWDAELVLVSNDGELLQALSAPLGGDVQLVQSLVDADLHRSTVVTLRAGEVVDVQEVHRRTSSESADLSVVLVCDDDAEAAAASVLSVAAAVERHPAQAVHLVLVSRGGSAAGALLPALGRDVHVVEAARACGDEDAFALGCSTVAAHRWALLIAGDVVDDDAFDVLLAQSSRSAARIGRPTTRPALGTAAPSSDAPPSAPRVSVVIPVHNRADLTLACLQSIEATQAQTRTPFEVVIVDNASTDETPALLAGLSGDVRVIRNDTNAGFGEACNQGAAGSSGEYVLFLNNDTVVLDRWLDVLVDALDEDPRRGAVQPKLLYPDGRLNDAGGLVFRGGEAAVYGKGSPHPDAPAFDVRRAPDYASGACLLVRRRAFEEVGGFDSRYAPAYYEDTDLSFALRHAGWTLLYEPAAVVVHVEGGTAGTDEAVGFKAFQPRNKVKFADKWRADLELRPLLDLASLDAWAHRPQGGYGPGEHPDAPPDGLRVLVLDPFPPMHDRASGCRRTLEIEKALRSLGHVVVHEALHAAPDRARYARELSRWGIRLHGLDPAEPLVVDQAGAPVMRPVHRPGAYDVIVVGPWEQAEALMPVLREHFPDAMVVVDSCDLHYLREERIAGGSTPALAQRKSRELATYASADAVLVVSDLEAELLSTEISTPTFVVGNAHEAVQRPAPLAGRDGVVFVGNTLHTPNVDGARWLVEEVWPRVLAEAPSARLRLVGNDPAQVYRSLARPSVEAIGWVPDTAPVLDASRVSVAPLRAGAGVKGKIGEALSRGLPVVTTSIGAEGLALRSGENALVSDSAAGLAEHIVALLEDDEAWCRLSSAGRDHSAAALGTDRMRASVARVLQQHRPAAAATSADSRGAVGQELITLVINTKDEAANIQDCISACSGVDRVVVVDMASTDETVALAEALGAEVHTVPDAGYVEPARQYALSTVDQGWILLLDADERMAPGGVELLRQLLPQVPPEVAALQLTGHVFMGERPIRATGWEARLESHVRVMRAGRVQWPDQIHGVPSIDGVTAVVDPATGLYLDHTNWRDFAHFLEKTVRYTAVEARRAGRPQTSLADDVHEAVEEFVRRYSPDVDGEASFALSFGMLCYRLFTSLQVADARGFGRPAPDREAVARALRQLTEACRTPAAPSATAPVPAPRAAPFAAGSMFAFEGALA